MNRLVESLLVAGFMPVISGSVTIFLCDWCRLRKNGETLPGFKSSFGPYRARTPDYHGSQGFAWMDDPAATHSMNQF